MDRLGPDGVLVGLSALGFRRPASGVPVPDDGAGEADAAARQRAGGVRVSLTPPPTPSHKGRGSGVYGSYSCGYRHTFAGCRAVSSNVHCGSDSPSATSVNTIRMREPMPTRFTTSAGATAPSGVL